VQTAPELLLPSVEVFAGVGVERLVLAAVVLDIVGLVTSESDGAGAFGAGRGDQDSVIDGSLVNARAGQALPRVLAGLADVQREHVHTVSFPTAMGLTARREGAPSDVGWASGRAEQTAGGRQDQPVVKLRGDAVVIAPGRGRAAALSGIRISRRPH
jgi:hypothetical protein